MNIFGPGVITVIQRMAGMMYCRGHDIVMCPEAKLDGVMV